MIAEVARRLAGDAAGIETSPIALVQAGTGTGKTVAYALTGALIAAAKDKTLVISTATIALQEQLVLRDLPDIQAKAGMNFTFALAKGRRRYLCLSKLDASLEGRGQSSKTSDFFPDELLVNAPDQAQVLSLLLDSYGNGAWDGDRDSLAVVVDDQIWRGVSTDRSQCTNRQCSFFSQCAFFRAREGLDQVDVIVTNHDLLLADLASEESQILPPPESSVYVFDEAHHLVEKARSQWAGFLGRTTTRSVLEAGATLLDQLDQDLAAAELTEVAQTLSGKPGFAVVIAEALTCFDQLMQHFAGFEVDAMAQGDVGRYRFAGGEIDPSLQTECHHLGSLLGQLDRAVQDWRRTLEQSVSGASLKERLALEGLIPVLGGFSSRFVAAQRLLLLFGQPQAPEASPSARWLDFRPDDLLVHCTPIQVDDLLYEKLWTRCAGAVLTSATLAVGQDFELVAADLGLPEDVVGLIVPSPFDYAQQGRLRVPKMRQNPSDPNAHTEEIASLMPGLLTEFQSALVLFTSWRQFFAVIDALPADLRGDCLLQGESSKAELLNQHRDRVDAGKRSYLMGLASFAEGVDLPGDYCQQVIIAKIPFSVPDDPVGATQQEWIEAKGGNAFYELMLPHAALRLTQAAGRLLRTEQDSGVVTILDGRLTTKAYGRKLIAALPPFRWDPATTG